MKNNRHLIVLSDKQEQMLDNLVAKIGESKPSILRMALHFFHEKEKPEYIDIRKNQQSLKDRQITLAEQGKPTTKRELRKKDAAIALCESYGGKVEDGYCIYTHYCGSKDVPTIERLRITEEKIPLTVFDESYKQYQEGKDAYLDWCKAEGKDPYKIN